MKGNEHIAQVGHRAIWGGLHPFGLYPADRRHHAYVIGKTGSGKTTLLKNLILQDIEAGHGVGVLDPHGDLAEELLEHIPPHRSRDLVYFDATDEEHPFGFNLFRAVPAKSRHLVASGIVSAFRHLWREFWGPRLEYILYASIAALLEVENATILGVQRMLIDPTYRAWVVRQVKDPGVKLFWLREFESYDKRLLSESIAPVQNKVGQLMMSPLLRNILGQVGSRFDARFAMDRRRIVIANLAKGKIGEDKSNLLGSMLLTAFQLAAMSRADTPEQSRQDFFLFIDEFHNFATDSFASILSEARKYRLCLTLSHQYMGQMKPEVRDAVFGNVGSLLSFRVGEKDAQVLAREYGERYPASTFTSLGNHELWIKTLHAGLQQEPFLAIALPPPTVRHRSSRKEKSTSLSRERYTTPRLIIEDRIERWMRLHR